MAAVLGKNETYKTDAKSTKPKYYVLDMFPYPSGAGLHVGHPLGYIASDIVSRYKDIRDLVSCILLVMTASDYLQNNMQFRQGSIRLLQQKKILTVMRSS